MASVMNDHGARTGALVSETLDVGVDGAIGARPDVPTGLGVPGRCGGGSPKATEESGRWETASTLATSASRPPASLMDPSGTAATAVGSISSG